LSKEKNNSTDEYDDTQYYSTETTYEEDFDNGSNEHYRNNYSYGDDDDDRESNYDDKSKSKSKSKNVKKK